jgi:solute carrier family 25 (mitochondrial iron transporter), member 28/37
MEGQHQHSHHGHSHQHDHGHGGGEGSHEHGHQSNHSHHGHSHSDFDIQGLTGKEIAAGAIAGLVEHIGMFPFDTIKTRVQDEGSSVTSVVRNIVKHEKWTHLYRGCVPVLCSAVPAHGAYFSIYEASKRYCTKSRGETEESMVTIAISAIAATIAHDTVTIPFDVVKQRMQVDAKGIYASSWQCMRTVVRKEGFSKLFVALPTTAAMNIPHMTVQWLVYERLKDALVKRGKEEDEMAVPFVFAGLTAGAAAACVSTPVDNIKTRLQLGKDVSASDAVRSILRTRGTRGFFTGVIPRICHMAPSAALTLGTYEFAKSALDTWWS